MSHDTRSHGRHLLWAVPLALALAALGYFAAQRRGTLLEAALRDWAISEVAGATDSVYALAIAGVRFTAFPGRITFDSMRLTTDTVRNDFRRDPYPVLTATATGCRLQGIDTWQLVMARGLHARLFHCDEITTAVFEAVPDRPSAEPAAYGTKGGIPFVRDSIELPALLPVITFQKTELPRVTLDYSRRTRAGVESHIRLERLALQLRETRVDPAVPPEKRKPLFSEEALLTADTLAVQGHKLQPTVLGRLRMNFTDSTLLINSVVVGPRQSDAEWIRERKTRADLIRMRLDSARFSGVDYRRLGSIEGGVVARRGTLHGFQLDVLSDKRLPPRVPLKRRTPQEVIASLERPLLVDSVSVIGGKITYREHAVGHPDVGTMTWEQLRAEITDIRTVSTGGKPVPPVVIQASALLLGQGRLDTRIEIPLTATRFDMKYSGSLGPMSLLALNQFATKVTGARVTSGEVRSVKFAVVVRNGRSTGQVVPVYRDFKIVLEDKDGSFIKKTGLSIASFFANTFKVRSDNPGDPDEQPRAGRIDLPYDPTASLPKVFWFALRQGLNQVFMR